MPVTRIVPTANGTLQQWLTNDWARVNVDNGDTNFIRRDATGPAEGYSCYQADNLPSSATLVRNVVAGAVLRDHLTLPFPPDLNVHAAAALYYAGATWYSTPTDVFTGWTTVASAITAPPGGGVWTPQIVNATEVGVWAERLDPAEGGELRCTFIYADITWVTASGSFAYLLWPFVGPLVAVGWHEIPRLARAVSRLSRGRLRILPGEHRALWRDLRRGRARHFDLGRLAAA